jgi:spore cortex formation protein SpoVR/YcgB (stage V sporulation)
MESILDTFIISPYVHEQIIKILPKEKGEEIKSDELNCMREREREREREIYFAPKITSSFRRWQNEILRIISERSSSSFFFCFG